MARVRRAAAILLACGVLGAGVPASADPVKQGERVERYPASFRLKVAEAIERGVARLRILQRADGRWGDEDAQAMGHAALPLLALLKAGASASDPGVVSALRALDAMPFTHTYSTACYLMALHALYAPTTDALDTDVGSDRAVRIDPARVAASLTESHRTRMQEAVDFLVRSQTAKGLWGYGAAPGSTWNDLSNAQYALLGLRAAADSGLKVPHATWRSALAALLGYQDADGPAIDLLGFEVREGYAFRTRERARARGFRYQDSKKDGPMGERTVFEKDPTGSMTTAGVACVAICTEGMWRSRRFGGRERKEAQDAVRDGLAWVQERFAVDENPGAGRAHHLYYLYGLERMGMLTGRRWLGSRDWYREGADLLLAAQREPSGGWGGHVDTAFAILFLKRATRPPTLTGG